MRSVISATAGNQNAGTSTVSSQGSRPFTSPSATMPSAAKASAPPRARDQASATGRSGLVAAMWIASAGFFLLTRAAFRAAEAGDRIAAPALFGVMLVLAAIGMMVAALHDRRAG